MKMFKKIALSLSMLLAVAILSYSWTEKVSEPERYTINGNITVYQDVADAIVRRIKKFPSLGSVTVDGKNITISPSSGSSLLDEITMLLKKAKESRNEGSDILRRVSNKNGTIKALTFDIEKDLIFSIQLSKVSA